MATFKSIEAIQADILKKMRPAIANVEKQVHQVIDGTLKQFYAEFTPKEYIRTYQLMHSLVKSGVRSTGNGFEAEIYFDVGALNYETGFMTLQSTWETGRLGWATWSGGQVLETAMQGSHGGYVYGTPIWAMSMARLHPIIERIVAALIKQGIPIK